MKTSPSILPLCPEEIVTDYVAKLVEFPEALQVVEFANGRVTLVGVKAYEGGLLVGKPINAMRDHFPRASKRAFQPSSVAASRSRQRARRSSRRATRCSCWRPRR